MQNPVVLNAPSTSGLWRTPCMDIMRASVDMPSSSSTLQDKAISDAFYPSNRDSALCVASILRPRRSTSAYDISSQQWFDEDNDEEDQPAEVPNRLSTLTFGSQSFSSSPSSDSHTMAATDDDSHSIRSSVLEAQALNCLDEQLVLSPMDSFAALCWDSAVLSDQPNEPLKIPQEQRIAQLRLSTLYNDDARDYEEEQSIQSADLDTLALPRMQFVSKTQMVSPEVNLMICFRRITLLSTHRWHPGYTFHEKQHLYWIYLKIYSHWHYSKLYHNRAYTNTDIDAEWVLAYCKGQSLRNARKP
jgi:hypothetical protein